MNWRFVGCPLLEKVLALTTFTSRVSQRYWCALSRWKESNSMAICTCQAFSIPGTGASESASARNTSSSAGSSPLCTTHQSSAQAWPDAASSAAHSQVAALRETLRYTFMSPSLWGNASLPIVDRGGTRRAPERTPAISMTAARPRPGLPCPACAAA
ncbi:Uncharacterised protein [Acinetobacter baumannii]|nr:Uncharacterised protein [Acinetobacter baumannii]